MPSKSMFARQKVGSSWETLLHCASIVPHGSTICHININENETKSGPMIAELMAPPKGMDNSNKTDIPWRVPSLFGFGCVVQRLQRRSHRFVFRSHGFEGESPNELLRS